MSTARPGADGGDVVEDVATTRAKILAWADFTYRVATGRIPATANYCAQFEGGFDAIAAAMVPANFPWCSGGEDELTVGEFFSLRCGRPSFEPGKCDVLGGDGFVETVAKGALLHLIQDSYSQSHALRTDNPRRDEQGRALSSVACSKPRTYFAYTKDTKKAHGKADKIPVWEASCDAMSEAHDIITASAMALYHVDRNSEPEQFLGYLERHIF